MRKQEAELEIVRILLSIEKIKYKIQEAKE